MLREIKPKNARSARALAKKAPLATENTKSTLFLRSTSSSLLVNSILTDLHSLKRPFSIRFTKKNLIHPFEDASSLEFFSQKNDASLLVFGSHSKKRPHCLTFTRCFDGRVLDMLECGINPDTARTLAQFHGTKCRVGAKPMVTFSGTQFEEGAGKFGVAKSLFLDLFKGEETREIDVEGLQWMVSFAAGEDGKVEQGGNGAEMVYMRCWRIVTKRSGQKLPRVEVEEMGPRLDFRLGRCMEADDRLLREAMKKSKGSEPKTKKNVETDVVGDKIGRIHLGRQDLSDLQTRKMKGLKRERTAQEEEEEADGKNEEESTNDLLDGDAFTSSNEDENMFEEDDESDDVGGVGIDEAGDAKRQRLK